MRILLLEDNPDIAGPVTRCLRSDYAVDHAASCKEAQLLLEVHTYDIHVIDLGLPDGSGTEICKEILEKNPEALIIILSCELSENIRVSHLDLYAVDYLSKPFSLRELVIRIKNTSKQLVPKTSLEVKKHLVLHRGHKQAYVFDKLLPLRRKEFEVLSVLEQYINKPVLKSLLLEAIWDEQNEPLSNTIDAHICAVRKVLLRAGSPVRIQTIRGVGYQLTTQNVQQNSRLHYGERE
jgi:DNA-binding response OmpR family regulator